MTDCCLCVCLRPATFRRLIDDTYPRGTTGYESDLVPQKLTRLCDYAVNYPRKLPLIAQYLEQRITRDYKKGRYGYVKIGLSDFNQLVSVCHQQATLEFIEPHIARTLTMLLESSNAQYKALSLRAVIDYATVCEDAADATPYIRQIIRSVREFSESENSEASLVLSLEALLKLIDVLISNNAAQLEANMRDIMDVIIPNMRKSVGTTERKFEEKSEEEKERNKDNRPQRSSSLHNLAEEHDPGTLARECVVFTATASSPSTILKLLSTLFTIFDERDWEDKAFILEILELVTTSSENVNAYHLPIFHHLLCHLGSHLERSIAHALGQKEPKPQTSEDQLFQRFCLRNKRILAVTTDIINAASGEMPVHSLFEEDLHNLLLQVLYCVLQLPAVTPSSAATKSTPLEAKERAMSREYVEMPLIQELIDAVFKCISALAVRLPPSVDRVEVLNVMMTFLDQQGAQIREEICQKRLISYVLKAAVVMLTQSADVFGEEKVCPNFVVYKLVMLLQSMDKAVCDEAREVLQQILAWRNRCVQSQVVRVHIGLEHTDVHHWRPFTYLQCQCIRAGIYYAATQWNGVMQPEKIVSISKLSTAMLRAYRVKEILESLPVMNGISRFLTSYDFEGLTGDSFLVAVELATSLRYLLLSYFRTVAEILSSNELRAACDRVLENWKRYGSLPSMLSIEDAELRRVNAPRSNNPPILRKTHPEHDKLFMFDKATILPALLQSPKLADYAIQVRQAFEEEYKPPRDLGYLLKDEIISPRADQSESSRANRSSEMSSTAATAGARRSSMMLDPQEGQDSLQALMKVLDTTHVPEISSRRGTNASSYDSRLRIPVL